VSASPGQLKLHPHHAIKWIKNQALCIFVEKMKKLFKMNKWQGIAYIEKCWKVNLGRPGTKPDDVVCDVLLCSPQMPLVMVTLTQSEVPNETSSMYNKRVATMLKTTLVQEAGCLERFYVKPILISCQEIQEADLSSIVSENSVYPITYRISNEKYSNILEALVLVLAKANSMATHIIGQGLFNLLTYEQYKILHDFYESNEKVKITGPPGSGKTVLALERIHRLRMNGCFYDEVLFLCAYKPLKARVK
jgi:hypothetical protein